MLRRLCDRQLFRKLLHLFERKNDPFER